MEVIELFEEVGCEEFYGEDEDRRAWMDALELDFVNGELQMIAEQQAEARTEVEYDFLYFGA